MNKESKHAPLNLVILWLVIIHVSALLYHLPSSWKSGGVVGLLIGTIAACNTCYQKGYEDARSEGI